jgi:hypothetical protein
LIQEEISKKKLLNLVVSRAAPYLLSETLRQRVHQSPTVGNSEVCPEGNQRQSPTAGDPPAGLSPPGNFSPPAALAHRAGVSPVEASGVRLRGVLARLPLMAGCAALDTTRES